MYRDVMNAITERFMIDLKPTGTAVMIYIAKKTFKRWRVSAAISVEQFVSGDGEGQCGVGVQGQAVKQTLARLVDEGFLTKRTTSYRHSDRKNVFEIDCKKLLGEDFDMAKLREPKQQKTGNFKDSSVGENHPIKAFRPGENHLACVHIKDQEQNLKPKENLTRAVARGGVGGSLSAKDVVEETTVRHRRIRAVKAERAAAQATGRLPKKQDFEALWRQAMLRHWPRTPAVSVSIAQWGRLKTKLKDTATNESFSMQEVVDYAIENWPSIINTKLYWHKQVKSGEVGTAPNLAFFLSMIDRFILALNDSKMSAETNAKRLAVTPEKEMRAELDRLRTQVAKGEAERKRLTDVVRKQNRIMTEMDRKRSASQTYDPLRTPLKLADNEPIDDGDLGEWQ